MASSSQALTLLVIEIFHFHKDSSFGFTMRSYVFYRPSAWLICIKAARKRTLSITLKFHPLPHNFPAHSLFWWIVRFRWPISVVVILAFDPVSGRQFRSYTVTLNGVPLGGRVEDSRNGSTCEAFKKEHIGFQREALELDKRYGLPNREAKKS